MERSDGNEPAGNRRGSEKYLAIMVTQRAEVVNVLRDGWFTDRVDDFLMSHRVCRAAADPAITPFAAVPGGWTGLAYFRLHGSPVIYRSSYADRIEKIVETLIASSAKSKDVWCVFDNTASSAATQNALAVQDLVSCSGEANPAAATNICSPP